MKTSDIKGIIPPVITPMNNDDEQTVNHEALRQQVERPRHVPSGYQWRGLRPLF